MSSVASRPSRLKRPSPLASSLTSRPSGSSPPPRTQVRASRPVPAARCGPGTAACSTGSGAIAPRCLSGPSVGRRASLAATFLRVPTRCTALGCPERNVAQRGTQRATCATRRPALAAGCPPSPSRRPSPRSRRSWARPAGPTTGAPPPRARRARGPSSTSSWRSTTRASGPPAAVRRWAGCCVRSVPPRATPWWPLLSPAPSIQTRAAHSTRRLSAVQGHGVQRLGAAAGQWLRALLLPSPCAPPTLA